MGRIVTTSGKGANFADYALYLRDYRRFGIQVAWSYADIRRVYVKGRRG